MNLTHSSKPANTVYSPPKGFFRKYKSNLKQNHIINKRIYQTASIKTKKPCKHAWWGFSIGLNHVHSTFLMLARFPVGISHGELVLIRQDRRHHRVCGSGYSPTRIFLLGVFCCHGWSCVVQETKLFLYIIKKQNS